MTDLTALDAWAFGVSLLFALAFYICWRVEAFYARVLDLTNRENRVNRQEDEFRPTIELKP